MPLPGIFRPLTYRGDAIACPSRAYVSNLPNFVELTFAGVSVVSARFCPDRELSLWCVKVPGYVDTVTTALAVCVWSCDVTATVWMPDAFGDT
jgi:hypothetical protein